MSKTIPIDLEIDGRDFGYLFGYTRVRDWRYLWLRHRRVARITGEYPPVTISLENAQPTNPPLTPDTHTGIPR